MDEHWKKCRYPLWKNIITESWNLEVLSRLFSPWKHRCRLYFHHSSEKIQLQWAFRGIARWRTKFFLFFLLSLHILEKIWKYEDKLPDSMKNHCIVIDLQRWARTGRESENYFQIFHSSLWTSLSQNQRCFTINNPNSEDDPGPPLSQISRGAVAGSAWIASQRLHKSSIRFPTNFCKKLTRRTTCVRYRYPKHPESRNTSGRRARAGRRGGLSENYGISFQ